MIKVIDDIISVIGDREVPILLNLNSKFFISKTFSKKEISISKNNNLNIFSSSPFIEENTSIRTKDAFNNKSIESKIVVYSRKDIIQSLIFQSLLNFIIAYKLHYFELFLYLF